MGSTWMPKGAEPKSNAQRQKEFRQRRAREARQARQLKTALDDLRDAHFDASMLQVPGVPSFGLDRTDAELLWAIAQAWRTAAREIETALVRDAMPLGNVTRTGKTARGKRK